MNYTSCPFLEKCIFQCFASRNYATSNPDEDRQFYDSPFGLLNFYYGVYFGSTNLIQGGVTINNFQMPLVGGAYGSLSGTVAAGIALISTSLLFTF